MKELSTESIAAVIYDAAFQFGMSVQDAERAAEAIEKLYAPIIAEVWDEGYAAARQMARWWGHTDGWEDEPENPYG